MPLDLADFDALAQAATAHFWTARRSARQRQQARGTSDAGTRADVTDGKAMDGFGRLLQALTVANGLPASAVHTCTEPEGQRHTTLPGYYRPVKDWDLVVVHHGRLIAAVEFKSQVGPSFGNNFNNRCEEAIGMGEDLRVAIREGRFGGGQRPFIGYLLLLEDTARSTTPVSGASRHFGVDPVFSGLSYAARYDVLCRRLVSEGLYDAATLLLTPTSVEDSPATGYREWSPETALRPFVAAFASHIAAAAAL